MPQNTSRGYPYPLYPDTQNFPDQIEALAEAVNADVQLIDNVQTQALNEPTVRITCTVAQSAAVGAFTEITWAPGPANYDNAGMWNPATPTIITFTQPGIYLLSARLELPASGTATAVGTYTLLGTSGPFGPNPAGQTLRMEQNAPLRPDLLATYMVAAAGETLNVFLRHDKSTAFNIGTRSLQATRISTAIGLP